MSDVNEHEDMISAVRAAVEANSSKEETPVAAATASQERAGEPEAEKEESAPERERDEKGRFKASDEKSEAAPAKPPPTKEAVAAQPAPSTAPERRPPTSWSSEAKAEWSKLSPALQQAVLKREDEMAKGSQQYSSERQRLRELDEVITPQRREYYQRFGFKNDTEAVNHLFSMSEWLTNDPASAIIHLARTSGLDLNRLAGAAQQMPQQQPQQFQQQPQQFNQPPPNLEHMITEIIANRDAKISVQEFEQNAPEHYQEVRPLMKALLQSNQATDLQDAYDKAIWSNQNIRASLLEAQRAAEEQKRQEAARSKTAQKVKASNASLNGAPHGTPDKAAPSGRGTGHFTEVADDVRAAVAALR